MYKSATRPVRGEISVSMHPSVIERVFDLVGDPGNQLAVGGKLLYLNKAILRRATSRWH